MTRGRMGILYKFAISCYLWLLTVFLIIRLGTNVGCNDNQILPHTSVSSLPGLARGGQCWSSTSY